MGSHFKSIDDGNAPWDAMQQKTNYGQLCKAVFPPKKALTWDEIDQAKAVYEARTAAGAASTPVPSLAAAMPVERDPEAEFWDTVDGPAALSSSSAAPGTPAAAGRRQPMVPPAAGRGKCRGRPSGAAASMTPAAGTPAPGTPLPLPITGRRPRSQAAAGQREAKAPRLSSKPGAITKLLESVKSEHGGMLQEFKVGGLFLR